MSQSVNLHPGGDNKGTIPVELYLASDSNKTVVFIGGSGDIGDYGTLIFDISVDMSST